MVTWVYDSVKGMLIRGRAYRGPLTLEGLLARTVEGPIPPGYDKPCRLWARGLTNGYPCVRDGDRRVGAHRKVWELANGRLIRDGWQIDHGCRVPICIEPSHLDEVTPTENNRRKAAAHGWRTYEKMPGAVRI